MQNNDALALLEKAAYSPWKADRARDWQQKNGWLVGCNFTPSNAINQLEMWQAETFSPELIDQELGWLAAFGMNSVRVFLHDFLWAQDKQGFVNRVSQYLDIAEKHGISTLLVFFDSCWNPEPVVGHQRAPTPGVHNSYWAQSPPTRVKADPAAFARLEGYVTSFVEAFRDDPRIIGWDVWNEPENLKLTPPFKTDEQSLIDSCPRILPLLAQAFDWVRAARPTQPLTSGIWRGDWSMDEKMTPLHLFQVLASDVVSFHTYLEPEESKKTVTPLQRFGRPLLCTEYLARGRGNTFQAILPWFKEQGINAYNWGAVSGKTQTIYPWDSCQTPYEKEPEVWHHDILRPDGTPFDPAETKLIRELTQVQ